MDRYIRDELLDHQDDFTDLPEQGENERGAADPAFPAHRPGTRNPSGSVRHNFNPKLRKAAVIAALNLACKHTREDEGGHGAHSGGCGGQASARRTMSLHTISGVGPSSQWQHAEHGTFVDYQLRLAGLEKIAILTQKESTAPPQSGQTIDVDLQPHPKFSDKLKAKKVPQQGGGNGSRGDDPATRASIEKQVALKAAVEFHKGDGKPPQDVVTTAAVFQQWLGAS
jgi:hypothetical protein